MKKYRLLISFFVILLVFGVFKPVLSAQPDCTMRMVDTYVLQNGAYVRKTGYQPDCSGNTSSINKQRQSARTNQQYNVYTPTSYKQVEVVQSPKNARVVGTAVELLVDYSGSMRSWINIAIETLEYILPKIPDTSNVALRVFGDTGLYYNNHCKATRLVTYFKKNNQPNIIKGLREANVGGSTPLEFALRETIEKDMRTLTVTSKKQTEKNKKIILVTDGDDVCGGDPCAYIRQIVKTRNDIQIDVIQLGSSTNLMCLTAATGGRFFKADGSRKKFEAAFESTFNVPHGTIEQGRKQTAKPVNQQSEPQNKQQNTQKGYKFINF